MIDVFVIDDHPIMVDGLVEAFKDKKDNINIVDQKVQLCSPDHREPVWPSGKVLGWQAEGPRFESASALLSLQQLWSVDTVL